MNVLEVDGLAIASRSSGRLLVPGLSFRVREGSCLAIVGESGSGKSISCKAIARLNPPDLRQTGSIRFRGTELSALPERELRRLRGRRIGLILQHGMRAFDPARRVGRQTEAVLRTHHGWSAEEAGERMAAAMETMLLKEPRSLLERFPHELSGGMLQRLMIALSIVLQPDLVIADEPTTALDAASRYEAVRQLMLLREQAGCSLILISHDLAAVERIADDVLVLRQGIAVESGRAQDVLSAPQHAYTRMLTEARRSLTARFEQAWGGDVHAGC
ncbi:ATP-binding cassette domain-containing protein [Paenibacillus pasadenensis]|uniref:Oligopeptide transport system permease protein OppB n=1 Tax=Paenibacillus pasadenensis TaxID=217090 RepID=A0A2N5NB68_9BACL|nr:ABC transporter ATP-binding protein [Paenibacillus pasadenensis]PLT47599.1 Oligopeptide transport system permease protein OppB [Paenibacillus pasadenensis]